MVSGAADVCRAFIAKQAQQGVHESHDRADVPPVSGDRSGPGRVVGAEQLIRGIDEMELHGRTLAVPVDPHDMGPTGLAGRACHRPPSVSPPPFAHRPA